MQRLFIQLLNGFVLVLVLIGIPAITGFNLGSFRLSHTPTSQMLTLWGLGLAVAVNLLGGAFLAKGGKARRLCWFWMGAFAAILVIEHLYFDGSISFHWLKRLLKRR